MDIVTTILSAAKVAKVSGVLLLAICSHESGGFKYNYTPMDHGSPSYGSCQLKLETARMLNFKGSPMELMDPKINAKYAALYLKYQQSRYGEENWCVLTASYNSGSYMESRQNPRFPRNLKYVRLVQNKLSDDFKNRLSCGQEMAENP